MTKERRLGRGLEALLGRMPQKSGTPEQTPQATELPQANEGAEAYGPKEGHSASEPTPAMPPGDARIGADAPYASLPEQYAPEEQVPREPADPSVIDVDVQLIESNPFQPRQTFDAAEMESLAESLTSHGLLQPIVVRRVGETYQLVAGERRFRAAQHLGWREVPVKVVDADDRTTAELAIVENMQRKDLNPLEKAASFQRYLQQYGCPQEELAGRLKIDRSTISNLIRLLELPEAVQDAIRKAKITQGHARALLPLGDEREQIDFSNRIQREGLSVRKTEALVQEMITAADAEPLALVDRDGKRTRPGRTQSEHLAALEQELRAALGVKVKITHGARGRGKITITFRSHEEFDRLKHHICGPDQPASQAQVG